MPLSIAFELSDQDIEHFTSAQKAARLTKPIAVSTRATRAALCRQRAGTSPAVSDGS